MRAIILGTLLILSPQASAADWSWGGWDYGRQATFLGLLAVDWGQTLDLTTKYEHRTYKTWNHETGELTEQEETYDRHETNPILGKFPTRAEVNKYMAIAAVAHTAISAALPRRATVDGVEYNPRAAWQYVTIAVEAGYVANNYKLGLKINF